MVNLVGAIAGIAISAGTPWRLPVSTRYAVFG
jgi:hypothetical protein